MKKPSEMTKIWLKLTIVMAILGATFGCPILGGIFLFYAGMLYLTDL